MTRALWIGIAVLGAVSAEPSLTAQAHGITCPQSARPTIWFDAQRDTAGTQALSDIRICLDGVGISAAQADVVGDELVIRGATVTISRKTALTLSKRRRTVLRGDQVPDLPQR